MMMHDEFDSPISTYDLWCHAPALVHLTTATGDGNKCLVYLLFVITIELGKNRENLEVVLLECEL